MEKAAELEKKLKNKIGMQIGFLLHSGKDESDVIRDIFELAKQHFEPAMTSTPVDEDLKRTLARAHLLIDKKVIDNLGIRVDIGTVFNKDQVLRELEKELQKLGALGPEKFSTS